jgi:isoleucyl-tRNA synthetase
MEYVHHMQLLLTTPHLLFLQSFFSQFILDEKGQKMAKSQGNVVAPSLIISGGKDLKKNPPYGVDTLRLFVASSDYTKDVVYADSIIRKCQLFN